MSFKTIGKIIIFFVGLIPHRLHGVQNYMGILTPSNFEHTEVVMPPSPLSVQVLFVGGVDEVETTPTYGNPAGKAVAKEWHDFIGFTPDNSGD
ncbi:hypothetical protein, partial [Okeania sp. SIO2B9]|uniref:hypothetical protein n=1 Tax=Okeania sp. SIO2B9 TaxID=2607782 RepID=UPI00142B8013